MSLTWDIRTVLASEAAPVAADDSDGKAASGAETSLRRLEPIDIWNYLISLSQDGSGSKSDSETDYTKLWHYKATDFDQSWDGVAKYVGDGASYSVDKCTLNQTIGGKPVVVAVKKLKIFQEHSYRDEANSAAHQRSVATVLKELRILTHPPLQSHLNIVSLLGYRSEFVSGSSSSLYSTNVSLVAEFAPFGTLKDFCQSLSPDKKLDLRTKAHLMHDIASGIEALHKCAIAHGDVKMENTLVFEGYGRPYLAKLSDFGHSLVDLHTREGESQVYLGTPIFNAPEIRSRSHFVPMEPESLFKCDIYSFGLLCWELVLGGVRYYKTLGDLVGTDDITAAVSRLSTLPKDELLFRSITSLKESHGSEDASLVQILNRVLQACLKDEPNDREDIHTVVRYFRQQQAFSNKLWMRQIGFSSTQDKDKPWAAPLKPFVGADRPSVATLAIPQMPLVVQTDLVDQLRSAAETSTSKVDKRRSLFDLATCHLSGVGTEKADIPKALGLLAEAAQLGSYKALTLVFRLHEALLGEVPPELWEIKHPITRLEKSLSQLDSRMYFPERLRGHENMQQADALNCIFDTRQKGETILQGVHLQDAHARLQELPGLCAEDLECISNLEEDDPDMPQIQGNLLVTAARLGLLPLVEFLLARRAADKALSEDVLTAACRGGHIDMLRLLLSKGVSMLSAGSDPRAMPLHWLGGFSPGETSVALQLLLSVPGGKECLLQSTPDPGIQIGDCLVSGTPLEIAIATNNTPLVQAFLAINLADINPQDHPQSIGWTANTYPLAVALNLHHLLPSLFDSEKTYRSSLWATPSFPPLSLFDLTHPHDPLLPLLIHSHTLPTALSSTITFILSIGTTTLNSPSPSGTTPLSHAVRHAPCRFSLEPIPSLISLGARFSPAEEAEPLSLTSTILQRRDAAAPSIISHLLSTNLLPLDATVLAAALHAGNTSAASAILDTRVAGRGIDPNAPLVAGEMRIPLLSVAIGLANAATVRLLLDRGARLDIRWDDKDPLEAAVTASNCDGDTIDLLLERGAAVELGGYTILHRAAMGRATVRGVHVLFHLLDHERVRALVNACVEGVTALAMAVYAGNVSGVHALLQAGAVVESGGVLERLVGMAVEAGRRPRTASPTWTERAPDGEELYQWRVGMEEIVLALLDRGDPGHGRTSLHVAVQLGNRARVVELVEEGGMRMFVGDRERFTPGALLEDIEGLEEAGEEEEYLEELRRLREYIQRRMIDEVVADSTTPESLERWLGDHPVSPNDDEENRNAIADLEGTLQKLKLEREETELSGGDGTESVAEREAKLRKAVELQRQRLGDTDLATLRAMTNLYECLANQGKFEEASALHQTVLEQRQAQLPPDHIDLWESLVDKTCMTWGLGRVQEANDYALALSLNALDTFGAHHPVTIKVETARAGTESSLGNQAEAVRIQEAVLELDERASRSQPISDPNPDLDFHEPLFYLRASLTLDYCRAQNFPAAAELSNSLSYRLAIAKPKEFFQIFDTLLGVAAGLDLHALHEASEPILTAVVETCLKTHGKRKSYATQTALERLASHYGQRGLWEKQAKTLATLVDQLKSTVGPDHADTIQQKRGLATALGKCGSWVEAGLLQEQVLKALEQQQQQASSPNGTPSPSQSLELEIAAIKTSLCETLRHQNQLTRSESHGWDAVHSYRAALGADHATTLSAEHQLGLTLSFASKPTEAITLLERRVASTVRTHGESHMQTGVAAQALCGALLRAGRHAEAETQAVRCLEIARAVPEANDETVGIALYMVAMCKARRGDADGARALHAASLERLRGFAGGVVSADMLTGMGALARLHVEAGDYAAAEPLVREMLGAAEVDSEPAQLASYLLGQVCEETDRGGEAVDHYRAAAESARRVLGDADETTLVYVGDLVRALVAEGVMTEAFELAAELLKRRREIHGEYHGETVETKKDLIFIYPALGFWPEAERVQRDVLRFTETKHPDQVEDVCILLEALVESCGKQGWTAEAEGFGRRAMDLRLARGSIEDEATLRNIANLARVLVDHGKTDEAEGMLDLVQDTCQHVFDDGDDARDIALPARAYLLFKQGRLDEAVTLQQNVVANDRDNLDAILFLVQLHEKLGDYESARRVLRKATSVAFSESSAASGELEKSGLVRTFIQDVRLKTATGDVGDAVGMGRMALARTEKWRRLNYAHGELHLECLQAMEALYEALGEEEEVLQMRLKIKEQIHRREEDRKQHLQQLQTEADRFEEFRAGLVKHDVQMYLDPLELSVYNGEGAK